MEDGNVECISNHYDDIPAKVFIHTDVDIRGYQKFVNLISCVQKDQWLVTKRLPYGKDYPKLGSLRLVGRRLGGLIACLSVEKESLKPL
jgi:hypothetical protein